MDPGFPGNPKNIKNRCQERKAKMEAQSQKIRGLNLNPFAPAQSKFHFPIFWKNLKFHRKNINSSSIFLSFFTLFRSVSRKPEKGAQGPAREPQKHTKMDPKGAQTESTNQQTEPQGPTKYEKHAKEVTKGGKVEPQALQWSRRAPQSARKAQKVFPKCE
jgi:hypothetical protein